MSKGVLDLLEAVSRRWLDPDDPHRREALAQIPSSAGYDASSLALGLDRTFETLSGEGLSLFLKRSDLERPIPLGSGPRVLVIPGGTVPDPTVRSVYRALLAGSPDIRIKPPSVEPHFAPLLVRTIREEGVRLDLPGLGIDTLLATRDEPDVLQRAFESVDAVILYGGDEAVERVGARLPRSVRFLPHGHAISLALVCRQCLGSTSLPALASGIARDVALYDQAGCLSPIGVYVERGGEQVASELAHALAGSLADLEETMPRGPFGAVRTGAAVLAERARLEFSRGAVLWTPGLATHWTVALVSDPLLEPVPPARFLPVRAVDDLTRIEPNLGSLAGKIQGVALCRGPHDDRVERAARALGPSLVRPAGRLQDPPADWCEDGRDDLVDLCS